MTAVNRPTRSTVALRKPPPRELSAPPVLVDENSGTPFQFLLPVLGAVTSVVMMVVLRNGQPLFLVVAALIFVVALVGGLAFALSARGRAARQLRTRRNRYLDYLERTRGELREEADETRRRARLLHPDPAGLMTFALDPTRLWERRRDDADHLAVRVGTASVPWFELGVPDVSTPVEPADPILQQEAELLAVTHGTIEGMPAVAELEEAAVVAIIGPRERTTALARGIALQLATHHTPDDVPLALVHAPDRHDEWRGFDLLPHAHDPELFDGPVPARRIAPSTLDLAQVLAGELQRRSRAAATARRRGLSGADEPRLVVIVDGHGDAATALPLPDRSMHARDLGITVVHLLDDRLDEPDDVDIRIELGERATLTHGARGDARVAFDFAPDDVQVWRLESVARILAARRTFDAVEAEATERAAADITDLLGLEGDGGEIRLAPWSERSPAEFLRVPFGVDDRGRLVHLDIKESAQHGMGPHGLCIGATGSGKSELLRTLILALATAHSPEDLSMILVDYKGGAAFAPFAPLPHLAGLIDNLADDPQLTVRARTSLQGEVVRRQQLLKEAGSSPSITHYRQMRRDRPDLPPMPHLFVVIDEFGELLTAEPDFIDLFLQIGRIGRSIGVHLLLSSQRVEQGKLRGLDTYLSYRLGLRTFSEAESQVVLDSKDAFHLPPLPGYGYLKVDTTVYQRFRAGFVSGPLPTGVRAHAIETARRVHRLPIYNGIESGDDAPATPVLRRPDTGRNVVDEVSERLRDRAEPVAPVWLPPLPDELSLGAVLERAPERPPLSVVVGLDDDPANQRQNPWVLDLTAAGGHIAIIGAPQSGRTNALRTIGAALALQCTPKQVAVYGMDLTGSGLRRLEGFPHVGGVATRGDEGRLSRLIEELTAMLRTREALFKARGIDSVAQLRAMHANGRLPELPSADIVLLVDGYGALRSDYEQLETPFTQLMLQASGYGIHLVLALGRWNELRIAHQSLFGTRIELRLNDAADSIIDRKLARTIEVSTPGRALTDVGRLAQFALPTLELVPQDEIGEALEALAARSKESWSGPMAAPIRVLPNRIDPSELPDEVDEPSAVPLGLRQDTMSTAVWDFADHDQHLLVLGDAKSGKSTTLRTIAEGLIARFTPDELAIAVVDPRGHVPAVIPDEYLAAHATSTQQASGLAASIASELAQRPGRTAAENAKAPKVVLLVDDYDIVAAGGLDPLGALLPHLPAARDLRFHVVIARPIAGAARALYAPFLQGIRDTGGAVLLMSGDRAEGQILPRVYPERMPPGRGRYVRRGETPHIIQVADTPEPTAGEDA